MQKTMILRFWEGFQDWWNNIHPWCKYYLGTQFSQFPARGPSSSYRPLRWVHWGTLHTSCRSPSCVSFAWVHAADSTPACPPRRTWRSAPSPVHACRKLLRSWSGTSSCISWRRTVSSLHSKISKSSWNNCNKALVIQRRGREVTE